MIFRKVLAIVDYLGALVLLLLAFLGGHIFYPIMYTFRHSIRNTPVFWWWFDDEDGYYGADYWRLEKGITKHNILVSYRWSGLRNPMWNAHTKIRPPSGKETIVKGYGKLTRNGEEVGLGNDAHIAFEDANGNYQGNLGDIFSFYFSYIGWALIFFNKGGNRLYWRFSLAKKIYKKYWLVLQFGAFHRYIFKFKKVINNN